MIRPRKAESNVLAEIIMVGIAITLSTSVFLAMADDDTADHFGSLVGTFEAPSESLAIVELVKKCPGTDASVIVQNIGGLDANVRAVAINDATSNTSINARYPSSATIKSLIHGSTSDSLLNAQCNDATYLDIASDFDDDEEQYESSAIFSGSTDQPLPSSMSLSFDSTFTTPGVSVTLQAFDYTIGDYSTTSDGKGSYTFATPGSDYSVMKELTPSKFLSNDQWKFKVTATHPSSFTMRIDLIQVDVVVDEEPLLREVTYPNNIVIQPGQTIMVDSSLSRSLDSDTAYRVTVSTERNSYSEVVTFADNADGIGGAIGYVDEYGDDDDDDDDDD